jgi:hypothetical protein
MPSASETGFCQKDMHNLMSIAERNSEGNKPDGKSYFHIANYIDANGYGGI